MTDDETKEAVLNALSDKVAKSDQNIMSFPGNKKAGNLTLTRFSTF